jgi:hypothetical protein
MDIAGWTIRTTSERGKRLWHVGDRDPEAARDLAARFAHGTTITEVVNPISPDRAAGLALAGGEVREIK